MLEVRDLSVRFGGLRALSNISFDVGAGEIVALIGPNGAGKSTLVNAVSGTLPGSEGRIFFCGQDVTGWSPSRVATLGLARTFQLVQPFRGLTALECVTLGALYGNASDRPAGVSAARSFAQSTLELCGLAANADMQCEALNASQRRRLEIARALAARPQLILLDEALSGMNSSELESGIALVRLIHARGISILMIEHMVRVVAELADRIIVLDHGEMISSGPAATVLADPRAVDVYFGSNPLQANS